MYKLNEAEAILLSFNEKLVNKYAFCILKMQNFSLNIKMQLLSSPLLSRLNRRNVASTLHVIC